MSWQNKNDPIIYRACPSSRLGGWKNFAGETRKLERMSRWRAETEQVSRWLAHGLWEAERGFRRCGARGRAWGAKEGNEVPQKVVGGGGRLPPPPCQRKALALNAKRNTMKIMAVLPMDGAPGKTRRRYVYATMNYI